MPKFRDGEVTLAPDPRSSLVAVGVGVFIMGIGGYFLLQAPGEPGAWLLAAPWFVLGALVARRLSTMRVTMTRSPITVRGFFRTRTLERKQVIALTDYPGLSWRTPKGTRRWTPMMALRTSEMNPQWMANRNAHQIAQVRHWLDPEASEEAEH